LRPRIAVAGDQVLLKPVIAVLRHRSRARLADLLSQSELQVDEIEDDDGWDRELCLCLQLTAPISTYEQLKNLRQEEREAIIQAFTECHRDGPRAKYLRPVLDTASLAQPQEPSASLVDEIEAQRSVMVDVATGGSRIQEVDEQYIARRGRIAQALAEICVEDPNPFDSLWDWYGKWNKDLPTYRSRLSICQSSSDRRLRNSERVLARRVNTCSRSQRGGPPSIAGKFRCANCSNGHSPRSSSRVWAFTAASC
jgi:hypothetical protein